MRINLFNTPNRYCIILVYEMCIFIHPNKVEEIVFLMTVTLI